MSTTTAVRFLHSADWQIGMTRRWLHGEAQSRFSDDRVEGIRRLGALAAAQGCEFVVVAGDVFESNQLQRRTVLRALEALRDVPVPVYLLPGNHDPLDALSVYRQPLFREHCPPHVHVLDTPGPLAVREGLEIIAVPWHGKHPEHDLVGAALDRVGPADGTVRVLVGHGAVDLYETSRHHRAAIAVAPLEEAVRRGRVHYVALGDRHSRTPVGDTGAIWYSGTHEVTDHREQAPGDVLVVDLAHGSPPRVSTHHVGVWEFRTVRAELSGMQDVRRLEAELAAIPRKERVVLKVVLRGAIGMEENRVLTGVLAAQEDLLGGLRDSASHPDLTVLTGQEDWQALGLGGFVAAAVREIDDLSSRPVTGTVSAGHASHADQAGDGRDEPPQAESGDLPGSPRAFRFEPVREPDPASARDALALLYRLTKESAR